MLNRSNSHICRALLKNDYSNFSLTIIEYCEAEQCIEREDYYLSSLPHEYNILEKAGSSQGRKHSNKTKQIMSDTHKGKTHSDETKIKISESNKGKTHSEESKTKISDALKGKNRTKGSGRPSQQIEVTDITNNTTNYYDSIREAARALNIEKSVIVKYFTNNQTKPYKGQYTFKKL